MTDLALKHGLSFSDLYDRDGLIRLDRAFVAHLAATDAGLHARLMAGRADPEALDRKAESDLLVDLAPHFEELDTLIGGPPADFGSRQGALAWELRYAEAVGYWLEDEAAHPLPLKAALQ